MALPKNKLDEWYQLQKEVYQNWTAEDVRKEYNLIVIPGTEEVQGQSATNMRMLIKKIMKERLKLIKKEIKSVHELEDIINSLKFEITYN